MFPSTPRMPPAACCPPALALLHIDGEAVACDDNGVTSFNRVRYRRHDESIFLYAFDLIELNGDDLRRDPLEGRKARLEIILAKTGPGIRFNEHMTGDGETVFRHACKLGLEGIVSKRRRGLIAKWPAESGCPKNDGYSKPNL